MKKTKYFFDTEFHCFKWKGVTTIQLISIGMVDENGNKLYLISKEFSTKKAWANYWIRKNVCMKLDSSIVNYKTFKDYINNYGSTREVIKNTITEFCKNNPEFWVYNGSYDWVVLNWIFMNTNYAEENFNNYPMDLGNVIELFGINIKKLKEEIPNNNLHNSLEDAKWNKRVWEFINNDCKHG